MSLGNYRHAYLRIAGELVDLATAAERRAALKMLQTEGLSSAVGRLDDDGHQTALRLLGQTPAAAAKLWGTIDPNMRVPVLLFATYLALRTANITGEAEVVGTVIGMPYRKALQFSATQLLHHPEPAIAPRLEAMLRRT